MTIARLLTLLARFESHVPTNRRARKLPPLIILTDAARGFTIQEQLKRWPHSVAFVERTFGNAICVPDNKSHSAIRLATCTPRQAHNAKLSGVHWPEKRLKHRLISKTRGMIETTSAHSGLAVAKAARLGMDAVFVSTAFASNSPSANRPLGVIRLARLQRAFPKARIFALGGINLKTATRLSRTQISGVSLVSFSDNRKKS